MHDRHAPRSTWYRVAPFKKRGAGNGNWGTVADYFDPADIPLNEPFDDPNWSDIGEADNRKVRVSSVSSESSVSEDF